MNNYEKLLKNVQRNCNKYIQLRDLFVSLGDVIATCISCKKMKVIRTSYDLKDFHAGHYFLENKYSSIRFDERNISGQCYRCNKRLSGNLAEYEINLIQKIGKKEFEQLNIDKNNIKKWSVKELEELNKYFLKKIKEEKKRLNVNFL